MIKIKRNDYNRVQFFTTNIIIQDNNKPPVINIPDFIKILEKNLVEEKKS